MSLAHVKARTAARKAAGAVPTYPAPRAARGPCRHRGDELTGAERQARGLPHAKRWALCTHPARVELGLAEVSCPCTGCHSGCRGYSAA